MQDYLELSVLVAFVRSDLESSDSLYDCKENILDYLDDMDTILRDHLPKNPWF